MKTILTTLVCLAFAGAGVEAQEKCKVVAKTTTTTVESSTCNLVPKRVCQISADRRSVMCYNTVNMETLEPFGSTRYYYGPTGPVPEKIQFERRTVVLKGQPVNPSCSRNMKEKTTTCMITGLRLHRDALGKWSYIPDNADAGYTDSKEKSNYSTSKSIVYK